MNYKLIISFIKYILQYFIEYILQYKLRFILTVSLILSFKYSHATIQTQKLLIGFYNCENFYDTINQSNVLDDDFLPNSDKKYNTEVFGKKVQKLSNVIYKIGLIEKVNGIAILGLAEVENKIVLNQLISSPILHKYHYKFIHFDSKDIRGVDVALLYNPSIFKPYQYFPISLSDANHFSKYATRDILYVKGQLGKEWVHIFVNHWPSRKGGEKYSAVRRIWASTVCKKIIDSIKTNEPLAKFIVMGDFNDNPNNKSIKQLALENPFEPLFKRGIGSIAYNDAWHLFDQILISPQWLLSENSIQKTNNFESSTYKSIVYKDAAMIENEGRYAGYPKRTYNGSQFNNGYSDHFPVALIFTLKMTENPQ